MASLSPAEEAELFQLIADAQTTNYLAAAAITLLVLEHISTFKEEVEYVWKSRLSLWSILYVWIRYFNLITLSVYVSFMFREMKSSTMPSLSFGRNGYLHSRGVSVDCILVLRVWLLYGRSRRLLYILVPLLLAETAVMLTFGALTILPLKQFLDIGLLLKGCYSLTVPRLFTIYAVPYFVMAIILFSLTLYKCGKHLRQAQFGRMPVVSLFLRDGLFLFMAIMLYGIVEIVIWDRGRPSLAQVPVIPAAVINAVVGARVLLNIKNLGSEVNNTTYVMGRSTLSQASRPAASKVHQPWYLQTGEVPSSGGLTEEIELQE
ncbi:hypothetical protein B0H17DRAFT_516350 [Mycena rosella]|uniref:DUF6533 domain-containing protein n=1 Tax=Mycena rosella TaxID=1033263 RepID=A0AAD7MA37_MYCRO|nr:hypothetical protein B0H17DRAFT_516350 [Mycena rosella]